MFVYSLFYMHLIGEIKFHSDVGSSKIIKVTLLGNVKGLLLWRTRAEKWRGWEGRGKKDGEKSYKFSI